MYFIALASHLHYVRPFWKLYPHNGGDLSALSLIFNPRWLKHPSAWLNVDRAIQRAGEEVEEWGTHPARSDGSEAAGISSRSDDYLNGGLMCNALGTHCNFPYRTNTRPSLQLMDVWSRDGASRCHPATSEEMAPHFVPRRRVTRVAPIDGNPGWLRGHDSRRRPPQCCWACWASDFRKSCSSSSVFMQKRLSGVCAVA